MRLAGSLEAKGVRVLLARPAQIVSRFGPTPGPLQKRMVAYVSAVQRYQAGLTIPVTASVLARHPRLIRNFAERGVEFAIHGLFHNDHSQLDLDQQRETLALAAEAFRAAGVPFSGFRGPYLRYNQATDMALRELGLLYNSSQAIAFPLAGEPDGRLDGYRRAAEYYRAKDAGNVSVRPADRDGLVQIPVALPDDEVMVDRMHLGGPAQAAAWLAVLAATHARGDLFTVQLHPERIYECAFALQALLAEARRCEPPVWLATLHQIASWWRRRARFKLDVLPAGARCFRVHLQADSDASLLVYGHGGAGFRPWHGKAELAETPIQEIESVRKPVVGVSTSTPAGAIAFLREEGFATEVAAGPEGLGAFLDLGQDWSPVGLLAELDSSPGPLVRIWRWPGSARSALAVTGDLDSITLQDFALRWWETRQLR
jgi:peptidoglycan/xylan/chitin deacetylase (PgdA/CDA1 family)